jgi:error-prone DNA polymerase
VAFWNPGSKSNAVSTSVSEEIIDMGWGNPPISWKEFERLLSDDRVTPCHADGNDSPAWTRKRDKYLPPHVLTRQSTTPYVELHCHSNFSFLDGASHPEELVEEAVRLGLNALAITDHNGFYGVVRFSEAARAFDLPTVFGTELALGVTKPQNGVADPEGEHVLVLARNPDGYASLARAISEAQFAGEKGAPKVSIETLTELHKNNWAVLTGCRKGMIPKALIDEGPSAADEKLYELIQRFGKENVFMELWDHGDPIDSVRNDALVSLAIKYGVEIVATNNVHYAGVSQRKLATAIAATRARRSLDEIDGWLPAASMSNLRSGDEQAERFARYPGVIERAYELGMLCAFDLKLVAPKLPDFPVPPGHSEMTWLRELTMRGAADRYGPPQSPRVKGAYEQIEHELRIIEELGFPGYFLVVWDIVQFCNRANIFCQGRGSAANSAVCYALGITNADAVSLGLLFERFLAPERDGPPDIDIDIESDRREEAIQYVYERYGRENAAQVANVITYRAKSALRDMAKALGNSQGQADAWSKHLDRWSGLRNQLEDPNGIPESVLELAAQVEDFPRHLGIHSGGMVICDRPVVEVCPVEWGRMPGRTVLQWDKEDCAAVGLVKFDLLGLGMLSALHYTVDFIREYHGEEIDLAKIPQEDAVYDMVDTADTVGLFQIESRAQMATLPRLKPRNFYDLVIEIALIRPGPIQGGSVHPYIRRRNGLEPVTYLHPLLEKSLKKTLGVPLFQEQLMQMAIDVAGFTPAEADQLRQAMGSKRSDQRMLALKGRFYSGMAERGIVGDIADQMFNKLAAFANFGFPESHSVSFAYLVYSSAWLRLHYPAAFLAALLNAQPMGFWSPQSLVADAQRHGVETLGVDVNRSAATATLEDGAVRLGLEYVRGLGRELGEQIANGRPYVDIQDLVRRNSNLSRSQLEAMATAGAFDCFALSRREALWAAGALEQAKEDRLPGITIGTEAPTLPGMNAADLVSANLWSTGITPEGSPMRLLRDWLNELGVVTTQHLLNVEHGARVTVGGIITHRQRPATARGITFINMEDETGMVNVVCSRGLWKRYNKTARNAAALFVRGRVEKDGGAINLVAERLEVLPLHMATKSRDFR